MLTATNNENVPPCNAPHITAAPAATKVAITHAIAAETNAKTTTTTTTTTHTTTTPTATTEAANKKVEKKPAPAKQALPHAEILPPLATAAVAAAAMSKDNKPGSPIPVTNFASWKPKKFKNQRPSEPKKRSGQRPKKSSEHTQGLDELRAIYLARKKKDKSTNVLDDTRATFLIKLKQSLQLRHVDKQHGGALSKDATVRLMRERQSLVRQHKK